MSSGRPGESVPLPSLAGAFSSGASAVAVVVAVKPSSALAVLFVVLALLARVRGVRCDISVLLYTVSKMTAHLSFSPNGSKGRDAAVVVN
jgi:hypothetical protein